MEPCLVLDGLETVASAISKSPEQEAPTLGRYVRIHGLVSRADLNGAKGTIVALPDVQNGDGRYGMLLDSGGKPVAVKEGNVEAVPFEALCWTPAFASNGSPVQRTEAINAALRAGHRLCLKPLSMGNVVEQLVALVKNAVQHRDKELLMPNAAQVKAAMAAGADACTLEALFVPSRMKTWMDGADFRAALCEELGGGVDHWLVLACFVRHAQICRSRIYMHAIVFVWT